MEMNKDDAGGARDEDPAASWTNETLAMPIRRQLLDRELRKVMSSKRARSGQGEGPSEGRQGHPKGDDHSEGHGG
jgi:hypothetical protein